MSSSYNQPLWSARNDRDSLTDDLFDPSYKVLGHVVALPRAIEIVLRTVKCARLHVRFSARCKRPRRTNESTVHEARPLILHEESILIHLSALPVPYTHHRISRSQASHKPV